MMKNQLFLFVTVVVILFSNVSIVNAYSDIDNSKEVDTICALGLMTGYEEGKFLPDKAVTRGEFSKIIAGMYTSGNEELLEWQKKYLKPKDEESKLIENIEDDKLMFTDVESNSDFYETVKIVCDFGFMTGVENGKFGIDDSLTYEQAFKVLITMLGYNVKADVYGGFPSGYKKIAKDLKLTSNMTMLTQYISRKDLAVLLYNSLEVKMLEAKSIGENTTYSTKESDTFLKSVLKMGKMTGRLTDNGYTNLIGQQVNYRDYVTIGNTKIKLTPETDYLRDLIGQTLNVYFYDNDGEYTMKYATSDGTDTITTFDSSDFVAYNLEKITYKSNDTNKYVSLKKGAYMIYNGSGKTSYNEKDFLFNKGTITLISTSKEQTADLIIVNRFDSFCLDYVDTTNKIIYSKKNAVNKTINLGRNDNFYLRIYGDNGELTDISKLKKGAILSIAESDNATLIYESKNKIDNVLISDVSSNSNEYIVSDGINKYKISRDYVDISGSEVIKVGKTYTLMMDFFGDIVYAEEVINPNYNIAVMMAVRASTDLNDIVELKFFGTDGIVTIRQFADKVVFLDSNNVEEKITSSDAIFKKIKNYTSIFRYKLDENKKINYMELPIKQRLFANENNRLCEITMSKDRDYYESNDSKGFYCKPNKSFGGQLLFNNKSFVFGINPDRIGDDTGYAIFTNSVFSDDGRYVVQGYTTVPDSCFAQYILYETKYGIDSTDENLPLNNKTVAIFDKMYSGVDKDGNPANFIRCYVNTKEINLCVPEDFKGVKNIQGDTTYIENSQEKNFVLEKGDVFRYIIDSDEKISVIQILFDENALNPSSGGKGNLAGTSGCWNALSSETASHSNPYALSKSGMKYHFSLDGNHWSTRGNSEMRNALYYPVLLKDNSQIRLTTQDLTMLRYDITGDGGKYVTDNYNISNAIFVSFKGENISVKSESLSNVKTYEITGNLCDRVFVMSRIGSINNIIIYSNYSE